MTRERVVRWLGSGVALVAMALVLRALVQDSTEWPQLSALFFAVWMMGVLVTVLGAAIAAQVWRGFIRASRTSKPPSFLQAFAICGSVQIAKYLPGNVLHLVGRPLLAARYGIAASTTTVSILVETALVAASASLVALPFFLQHAARALPMAHRVPWGWWLGAAVMLLMLALVTYALLPRLRPAFDNGRAMLTSTTVSVAVCFDVLTFLMHGLSWWVMSQVAWAEPAAIGPVACTSAFALAWLVGFLSPGAPGGIGIREGVFLVALGTAKVVGGSATDDPVAMAASLAFIGRTQSVCGDLLTFALARWAAKRTAPVDDAHPHA